MVPELTLSVVVPAYNEEKNISEAVSAIRAELKALNICHEIILVDDGSYDQTGTIMRELSAAAPETVRYLGLTENRGKGAALASGFALAKMEWLLMMDADLQIDMYALPLLLTHTDAADFIMGFRQQRNDPVARRIFSKLYGLLILSLFGIRCHDLNCPFKLIRSNVIKEAGLQSAGFFIDVEIIHNAMAKAKSIREVAVVGRGRKHGSSSVRFRHILQTVQELVRFFLRAGRVKV